MIWVTRYILSKHFSIICSFLSFYHCSTKAYHPKEPKARENHPAFLSAKQESLAKKFTATPCFSANRATATTVFLSSFGPARVYASSQPVRQPADTGDCRRKRTKSSRKSPRFLSCHERKPARHVKAIAVGRRAWQRSFRLHFVAPPVRPLAETGFAKPYFPANLLKARAVPARYNCSLW